MALIWCDGFDHYGTDENNMLDGVWAEVQSRFSLSATNPRTGTRALKLTGGSLSLDDFCRRIFGKGVVTGGFGHAFWLSFLPTDFGVTLASFRDGSNNAQLSIALTPTGAVRVRRGTPEVGTTLGTSADGAVTAGQYQHFECKYTIHDSTGAVEVRINGVTVLNLTGVDTKETGNSDARQVVFGHFGGLSTETVPDIYFDDMVAWDDTGTQNNDFIGDRRVLTLFPDQDTVEADWEVVSPSSPAGPGYEAINDAAPDDDTSYIHTDVINAISEFGLEDLPEGVSVISAIVAVNRMRKDDAGVCNVQVSMVSPGSPEAEVNGADRAITEAYTYWQDVFELDPATGAPWTPAALDAALLKFERTA